MILRYVHITEIHNICFLKKFKDFTAFIFTYVSHIFKVQEKNCYSQKRKLHIFKPTKCNDYFSFVIRLLQFSRLISVIFYLIYFQDCLLAYSFLVFVFQAQKKLTNVLPNMIIFCYLNYITFLGLTTRQVCYPEENSITWILFLFG